MIAKYKTWIAKNVIEKNNKCVEVTKAMQEVFPELQRVRGHYHCCFDGKRPHWWLKTINNEIVDPTAEQFKSYPMGGYEEHDESLGEPTGRCMECGDMCFGTYTFCRQDCCDSFCDSMGWERSELRKVQS